MGEMSDMPALSAYIAIAPRTNQAWRVSAEPAEKSGGASAGGSNAAALAQGNSVQLSEESLRKYNDYAAALRAGSVSHSVALSVAGMIHNPSGLSAEESEAFLANLPIDRLGLVERQQQEMNAANAVLGATSRQIEQTYTDLLEAIHAERPDLQDASFGFSVEAGGRLTLTNIEGLDSDQAAWLDHALNASADLVKQAGELADAQIALFKVENFSLGIDFDRDNYARTIDIGAELLARAGARDASRSDSASGVHQRNWDNNWRQQLWTHGERSLLKVEVG